MTYEYRLSISLKELFYTILLLFNLPTYFLIELCLFVELSSSSIYFDINIISKFRIRIDLLKHIYMHAVWGLINCIVKQAFVIVWIIKRLTCNLFNNCMFIYWYSIVCILLKLKYNLIENWIWVESDLNKLLYVSLLSKNMTVQPILI